MIACLILLILSEGWLHSQTESPSPASGPIRIVSLLWDANPANAAQTLTTTLDTAIRRDRIDELRNALQPIAAKTARMVEQEAHSDARFVSSLSVQLILRSDPTFLEPVVSRSLPRLREVEHAALLTSTWFATDPHSAFHFLETNVGQLAELQATPSLIQAAMDHSRPRAAEILIGRWQDLAHPAKLAAIEPLTASSDSMMLLVAAVKRGDVAKDLLNTNHLRKWTNSEERSLKQEIESVWGIIRESDNAERQALVASTLSMLNSGKTGSASRGQAVFTRVCSQCHEMHGIGLEVGPNIVGNGRGNLQQLVSNVLDPSLVIGEAFQAMTILTADGEVVSGLIAAENEQYLKLKLQGGKIVEFNKRDDIEQMKTSAKSLMPEGVESQMTQQEMLDLFAYLCLLKPLGVPDNELIPGTPIGFVEP